jgi:hypothetical protein
MAITHIANATPKSGSSGQNQDFTHGFTILSGDLIVFWIQRGDNGNTIIPDETWDDTDFRDLSGSETAVTMAGYLVAGGSEPSTYGFDLGSSTKYQINMMQFRGSNLEANTTIGWVEGFNTTADRAMFANAFDSVTLPANTLAVIMSGKDNRRTSGSYGTSNNGFTTGPGGPEEQASVMAYRVLTAEETLSGNVTTIDVGSPPSDDTFSTGIVFFEGSGGGGTTDISMFRRRIEGY